MEFASRERGGYFNAGDVDAYDFAEKVMAPHDKFEANWKSSMGGALYQAAMYRNSAGTVQEFVGKVLSGKINKGFPQNGHPVFTHVDRARDRRGRAGVAHNL